MKSFLIALIAITANVALAGPINYQQLVESSKEYKTFTKKMLSRKQSFGCSNYKVVSRTDLEAMLSESKMYAHAVVADCAFDPKDGGDSIDQRLLVWLTETQDEGKTYWSVQSISNVTPPQPD